MFIKKLIIPFLFSCLIFASCEKDDEALVNNYSPTKEEKKTTDEASTEGLEIEEFIYSGMNDIYLYKADVAVLADSYFSSGDEKTTFLRSFSSPESLFENLKSSDDRFSFITDDYVALENRFDGVSSSTGMKYGLGKISGTNRVFGYLEYILPNTSAEKAGLTRGTVFTEVNGTEMTMGNYSDLLDADSFTINTGTVEDGYIQMTDKTVTLNDDSYTTNPVYISKVLEIEGQKVGYLMYNSFTENFDDELNTAFADFKAKGISDLILDLRYNGGGSVESAINLASMITGQFEGKVFVKEQWNEKYQDYFENNKPEALVNRFDSKLRTGESINKLNLSKVYVLTTESTASASELILNGLAPYIDVVQVGGTTTGKFQASVTLYDSPDFNKEGASKDHTYAIQPLVFKSVNVSGKTDYVNGLAPDVQLTEDISNMGTLGDPSEPLLDAALNHLFGRSQETTKAARNEFGKKFLKIGESGMNEPGYQKMYIEELPSIDLE